MPYALAILIVVILMPIIFFEKTLSKSILAKLIIVTLMLALALLAPIIKTGKETYVVQESNEITNIQSITRDGPVFVIVDANATEYTITNPFDITVKDGEEFKLVIEKEIKRNTALGLYYESKSTSITIYTPAGTLNNNSSAFMLLSEN